MLDLNVKSEIGQVNVDFWSSTLKLSRNGLVVCSTAIPNMIIFIYILDLSRHVPFQVPSLFQANTVFAITIKEWLYSVYTQSCGGGGGGGGLVFLFVLFTLK